jgi:hypothetical protein
MMNKLFGNSPAKTGLGVAATGLVGMLARKLLSEDGWQGKLSDIIAGQSGAEGLSLGIHNLQQSADKVDPRNVFERSADMQREAVAGRK